LAQRVHFALPAGPFLAALTVAFAASSAGAVEVVAIVSAESTIPELTHTQVSDIFLGRISRLPDGQKVVPLDHPEGSPIRDAFYQEFAGRSAAQVKAHWSKIIFTGRGRPPAEVANNEAARERVREDPLVIAYVELDMVDDTVRIVSR
jgi:ABC-type phosphate transport system substrate-binding protein